MRGSTLGSARTDKRRDRHWYDASVHEAGHVILGLTAGLPIHSVRLRRTLLGNISGFTAVAPGNGSVIGTSEQDLFLTLGGPEAEAICVAQRDDIHLDQARRQVTRRAQRDNDFDIIAERLADPDIAFTPTQAYAEVNAELCGNWECVEQVAAELRERGRLSSRDIARLT